MDSNTTYTCDECGFAYCEHCDGVGLLTPHGAVCPACAEPDEDDGQPPEARP